ncbi:histone acetyltransferase [Dunaliella salina]|uniref:histone acetyltransferase n=1 Tax=Dunaliella salina TaxID=3046 RepID=A0ABQ7GDB1_DUNSA|nr:histone acetyltransferase [Dunaliella salina]|eukprot:KAF5832596.1 histone acetyltransferase [Dunaliella salina]
MDPAEKGKGSCNDSPYTEPGANSLREMHLIKMEAEGEISFKYAKNDGQPHNMIILIGLKQIYSKQLPNMPKEYICRLVLNRRHRSIALVKKNGLVVGGITYRTFPMQGLGEIAFCAITSSEQVKGFGARLMNYTKEYACTEDKLSHFLTYADNNAGLQHTVVNGRRQPFKVEDIPGVKESGWSLEAYAPKARCKLLLKDGPHSAIVCDATPENLQKFMARLLLEIEKHEDAWPFKAPVSKDEVPDYYDIIKDPVDLTLITSRLRRGDHYLNLDIFIADFKRMFTNCKIYNAADTIYYKIADKLETFLDQYISSHVFYEDQ